MTIHSNLKTLRLSRGMTQQQAADQLHLTRQAVSGYETGRTRPDVETLLRFAELYGTYLDTILYGGSRELKARRRLKAAAGTVPVLLVLLTTAASALMWTANRFYAVPPGGLTAEGREIFAVRQKLMGVWELLDAAVLTAALAGGLVLLVLSLLCRPPISAGRKLLYTAALVAALLPVPLLLGGTDPVYGMANYLITPFLALCRLLLFLLVSVIADALRQRRDTARQRT